MVNAETEYPGSWETDLIIASDIRRRHEPNHFVTIHQYTPHLHSPFGHSSFERETQNQTTLF